MAEKGNAAVAYERKDTTTVYVPARPVNETEFVKIIKSAESEVVKKIAGLILGIYA